MQSNGVRRNATISFNQLKLDAHEPLLSNCLVNPKNLADYRLTYFHKVRVCLIVLCFLVSKLFYKSVLCSGYFILKPEEKTGFENGFQKLL